MVVTQLVERLLLTPEVPQFESSHQKFLDSLSANCIEEANINYKEVGKLSFFNCTEGMRVMFKML